MLQGPLSRDITCGCQRAGPTCRTGAGSYFIRNSLCCELNTYLAAHLVLVGISGIQSVEYLK